MTRKAPNAIDIHIGCRVRARRLLVGLSQDKLGEQLGITFQQVQKYEKGTNRIGAGRLQQIADVLGVNVGFFYEGSPSSGLGVKSGDGLSENSVSGYVIDFISSSEGVELNKAFARIADAKIRRKIIDLIKTLDSGSSFS